MKENKVIDRGDQDANKIFDQRSLARNYAALVPLLRTGMSVLDVGCGTGAISKDIAVAVGPTGSVTGIDNTENFIDGGRQSYVAFENLTLVHADIFAFETKKKFDIIVSARTLQWLNNPLEALLKIKSMLVPHGIVSILDYNHEAIEWEPEPPASMRFFYDTFLKWRADAGMHNRIAEELPQLLASSGFKDILPVVSDENYHRDEPDFKIKAAIWNKVAASGQMVKEGYISDQARLQAIEDYAKWIEQDGVSMKMKLTEVSGSL